ncbi:hypothetical protein OAI20_05770 [Gammaproteobacteria bacterium]|nr:hypothetical protein [Gammaproteobacteria bacterium]
MSGLMEITPNELADKTFNNSIQFFS